MKISVLLALFIFLSCLSLILTIIGWTKKQRKIKTISLIIFLVSICLFSLTAIYAGKKIIDRTYTTAQTFPEKSEEIIKSIFIEGISLVWSDERNYLLDSSNPNPQIELLKSYIPEATLSSVNPDYFTYFGFRDWWRFPLVYPYSIHAIDTLDEGYLVDESQLKDFTNPNLKFDKNYLLLKIQNNANSPFVIFNFQTGKVMFPNTIFKTELEMFEKARELNFEGELKLITLEEYNNLF